MNNPNSTTIKVDKETRRLARLASGLTGETMNDLVLRLVMADLSTNGKGKLEKRIKETGVKYDVDRQ